MRRLGVLLANHRLVVWCLILVLSIPPICGLTGFNLFEQSYGRWVSEEQSKILQDVKKAFPNRSSGFPVILVLECDDFFQPERIAALHRTVEIVEEEFVRVDGDSRTFWIGSLPQVTLFGTSPLLPRDVETLEEAQSAAEVIVNHPLVEGQLWSSDRQTMLIGMIDSDRTANQDRAGEVLDAVGIECLLIRDLPGHRGRRTIHFLMRFRHEPEEGHDVESSIRRTFVTVGSALVMTTVVMVASIGSVMTSELQTHFLFASMACVTIGSALLGDLIILPALLTQFANRDTASPKSNTETFEGAADV